MGIAKIFRGKQAQITTSESSSLTRRMNRAYRLKEALERDMPPAKKKALQAEFDSLMGDIHAASEVYKKLVDE